MPKFTINFTYVETHTWELEREIEADSLEEAKELISAGDFGDVVGEPDCIDTLEIIINKVQRG